MKDRLGQHNISNEGLEMVINDYNGASDINIYFPRYDVIQKGYTYRKFLEGGIKCKVYPSLFGKAYIGIGEYKSSIDNKKTKCYKHWMHMLERCYSDAYKAKFPAYENCTVCDSWLNYQNFAKWYDDNYYEVQGEKMCLDKDILSNGEKIYSPETCVFVPNKLNNIYTKSNASRGTLPIGVTYHKQKHKYIARLSKFNKNVELGGYDTPQKAFNAYKQAKEKHVLEVANLYKSKIPDKLYNAMMDFKVNIND